MKNGRNGREQEFRDHYVCTFLATYAAMHYDKACAMGDHDKLEKHMAFEDAEYLASRAWERVNLDAMKGAVS